MAKEPKWWPFGRRERTCEFSDLPVGMATERRAVGLGAEPDAGSTDKKPLPGRRRGSVPCMPRSGGGSDDVGPRFYVS